MLVHIILFTCEFILNIHLKGLQKRSMKELKAQAKVGAGIKILWGALAKDICFALPRIIPNLVKEAQILEGDGGLGTVFLFKFGSG